VDGPNRAAAACVFGNYLALARGGKLSKVGPGYMFVVSGPGPATTRASTSADINALLAAVSGQKTKFAGKTPKGKPWPYYYGIQPTGYPDEPFIKELYYSNAATDLILSGATKVPQHMPPPPPPPPPPD
jgi:hypothetical protein